MRKQGCSEQLDPIVVFGDFAACDVRHVLETGEIIEEYPDDTPYPSQLMLGWHESRPLHIVVADNEDFQETIVVTVYEPGLSQWEPGFKRRRGV